MKEEIKNPEIKNPSVEYVILKQTYWKPIASVVKKFNEQKFNS